MRDLERAKALFQEGGYTCVLCKGEAVLTSTLPGIGPMVNWLGEGTEVQGFCAADKIVGRAAALLFVLGGIKEVFAAVMSKGAVEVFETHGIPCCYDTLTDTIINRAGTGACPMEQAVAGIDDPVRAFAAVRDTLAALKAGKKQS